MAVSQKSSLKANPMSSIGMPVVTGIDLKSLRMFRVEESSIKD
jgi:hypothetical protein